MKHEYKIAIFDLDGTLTNSRKELTPRTRETLIRLQQSGVKIVLASGRPTHGIVPLAKELELREWGGYILSYNGGVITECATREVIHHQLLPKEMIEPLYDAAKAHECVILSYEGDSILTEIVENKYVEHEAMLNKMPVRRIESFVETFQQPIPKCLAVGEPERALELERYLNERYSERMSIYRSEPFFVELVPLNVDKAQSLDLLSRHIGVPREDMIAFGDGFNDLSMIEYAGCGVAMANAQPEVKAKADIQTLSNDEDGVAYFVEKYML